MDKKLKISVIGVGFIGKKHIKNFSELASTELIAVTDTDNKKLRDITDKYNCLFYNNYNEMLKNKDIEAVSICLLEHNHVEPAIAAAKAGKHILLEKPMATTFQDCIKIKEACSENGVRIMVGHLLSFDPRYYKFYKEIREGNMGEVVHFNIEKKFLDQFVKLSREGLRCNTLLASMV